MKTLILLLFTIFIALNTSSQVIISVQSKTDKRYISYQDSLRKYNHYIKTLKYEHDRLESANTIWEYMRISDSLGFNVEGMPTTKDGKYMYGDKNKVKIEYILVNCWHCQLGDVACRYKFIVKKPSVKVIIATPLPSVIVDSCKSVNYIYETVVGDSKYIDSSKRVEYTIH